MKWLKVKGVYSSSLTDLRVMGRKGSHSEASCHPMHVNVPHLNSSQLGQYSIYLPRRDGRWS